MPVPGSVVWLRLGGCDRLGPSVLDEAALDWPRGRLALFRRDGSRGMRSWILDGSMENKKADRGRPTTSASSGRVLSLGDVDAWLRTTDISSEAHSTCRPYRVAIRSAAGLLMRVRNLSVLALKKSAVTEDR